MKWHGDRALKAFLILSSIMILGCSLLLLAIMWLTCWPVGLTVTLAVAIVLGAGFSPW